MKYATPVLGLAIVLASVATASAQAYELGCLERHVQETLQRGTEAQTVIYTADYRALKPPYKPFAHAEGPWDAECLGEIINKDGYRETVHFTLKWVRAPIKEYEKTKYLIQMHIPLRTVP